MAMYLYSLGLCVLVVNKYRRMIGLLWRCYAFISQTLRVYRSAFTSELGDGVRIF